MWHNIHTPSLQGKDSWHSALIVCGVQFLSSIITFGENLKLFSLQKFDLILVYLSLLAWLTLTEAAQQEAMFEPVAKKALRGHIYAVYERIRQLHCYEVGLVTAQNDWGVR